MSKARKPTKSSLGRPNTNPSTSPDSTVDDREQTATSSQVDRLTEQLNSLTNEDHRRVVGMAETMVRDEEFRDDGVPRPSPVFPDLSAVTVAMLYSATVELEALQRSSGAAHEREWGRSLRPDQFDRFARLVASLDGAAGYRDLEAYINTELESMVNPAAVEKVILRLARSLDKTADEVRGLTLVEAVTVLDSKSKTGHPRELEALGSNVPRQTRLKVLEGSQVPGFTIDGTPIPSFGTTENARAATHYVERLIKANGERVSFREFILLAVRV